MKGEIGGGVERMVNNGDRIGTPIAGKRARSDSPFKESEKKVKNYKLY